MSSYYKNKERIRQYAFKYLDLYSKGVNLSYYAVYVWQCYFTKYGRKYGLIREFRINGVI